MSIEINGAGVITGVDSLSTPAVTNTAGSASAPSITFTGDTNTGIYSPGADQVAISTNSTGRLFINSSGNVGIANSSPTNARLLVGDDLGAITTAARMIQVGHPSGGMLILGKDNTDYSYFAHEASTQTSNWFYRGGAGITLNSAGRVGVGTSSPSANLQVQPGNSDTSATAFAVRQNNAADTAQTTIVIASDPANSTGRITSSATSSPKLALRTGSTDAITIDSSQRVGIGITSVNATRQVEILQPSGYTSGLRIRSDGSGAYNEYFSGVSNWTIGSPHNTNALVFGDGSERARIDSSGRLLVGTSSAYAIGGFNRNTYIAPISGESDNHVVISATGAGTPGIFFTRTRGSTPTTYTVVQDGDTLGRIDFFGADGVDYSSCGARIAAQVDGTPGSDDLPSRLVFSTCGDGASSPTERMRITNSGQIWFNKTSNSFGATGIQFRPGTSDSWFTTDATNVVALNRLTNDGTLLEFAQDSVVEGSISVSGTTVSYNGAHLSRWSQLPSGSERTEILRGTVLSNIDEMCEWGDEDNEQLNRMKVSDVEGDKNVSGVFQAWDDDDDTYTNDFYCAMTGDFIIRIAAGATVERGDLLMSAGDGTAKPQDDDIIRSKTIAKVTSTNVSCTYDDGSYCVPCVLMAC